MEERRGSFSIIRSSIIKKLDILFCKVARMWSDDVAVSFKWYRCVTINCNYSVSGDISGVRLSFECAEKGARELVFMRRRTTCFWSGHVLLRS